jgi:hypothetical protein
LSRWQVIVLASVALAGVSLTACQSSQDKAREIQARAKAAAPKPLVIAHPSKDVKVEGTTLLHDQNGDAIVVELKNESAQTLVNVPILVDIRGANGKSVYENNTAGLDFALNHVAMIKPHESFFWVNDQVTAEGKKAKVTVGQPEGKAPSGKLPTFFTVSPPKAGHDFSGAKVNGTVTDQSKVDQDHLILFAVARQGSRIVAAGRGQIKALKAGAQPANYTIYFIGNPAGADVTIQAPPTVLH